MTLSGFAQFEAQARAACFDEVPERRWAPDTVGGEMWLTCEGGMQQCGAGDRFTLQRDVPHDKRYGPERRRLLGGAAQRLTRRTFPHARPTDSVFARSVALPI